jgi:hypothetical protein
VFLCICRIGRIEPFRIRLKDAQYFLQRLLIKGPDNARRRMTISDMERVTTALRQARDLIFPQIPLEYPRPFLRSSLSAVRAGLRGDSSSKRVCHGCHRDTCFNPRYLRQDQLEPIDLFLAPQLHYRINIKIFSS